MRNTRISRHGIGNMIKDLVSKIKHQVSLGSQHTIGSGIPPVYSPSRGRLPKAQGSGPRTCSRIRKFIQRGKLDPKSRSGLRFGIEFIGSYLPSWLRKDRAMLRLAETAPATGQEISCHKNIAFLGPSSRGSKVQDLCGLIPRFQLSGGV